jgi:predicted nucleotidyltransferase
VTPDQQTVPHRTVTERFLATARSVAEAFAQVPKVKGIMVCASVAQGLADESSDADLVLFCDFPTSELERAQIRKQLGATLWVPAEPKFGMFAKDHFWVQGLKIDLGHWEISAFDKIINDLLYHQDFRVDLQKQVLAILDALPLHGAPLIDRWKTQAAQYPAALAHTMVKNHLKNKPLLDLARTAAKRNDLLFFYQLITQMEENLICVLLGLNRIYHPGAFKRQAWFLDKFTLSPPNLSTRLNQIFRARPQQAIPLLESLLREIRALAKKHLPEAIGP